MIIIMYTMSLSLSFVLLAAKILPRIEILNLYIAGQEVVIENAHIIINCLTRMVSYPHMMVRDSSPKLEIFNAGICFWPIRSCILFSFCQDDSQQWAKVSMCSFSHPTVFKVSDCQMITLMLCLPCMC